MEYALKTLGHDGGKAITGAGIAQTFAKSWELAVPGFSSALVLPAAVDGKVNSGALLAEAVERFSAVLTRPEAEPLIKAARLAQLQAYELLISCLETLGAGLGVADAMLRAEFVRAVHELCQAELAAFDTPVLKPPVAGRFDFARLQGAHWQETSPLTPHTVKHRINAIALEDLEQSLGQTQIPANARRLLLELDGSGLGFHEAFVLYLAWQIKNDAAIRESISGEPYAALRRAGLTETAWLDGLFDLCGDIAARFDVYLQATYQHQPSIDAAVAQLPPLWWQSPLAGHYQALCRHVAQDETLPEAVLRYWLDKAAGGALQPGEMNAYLSVKAASYHDLKHALTQIAASSSEYRHDCTGAARRLADGDLAGAAERLEQKAAAIPSPTGPVHIYLLLGQILHLACNYQRAVKAYVQVLEYAMRGKPEDLLKTASLIVHALVSAGREFGNREPLKYAQQIIPLFLAKFKKRDDPRSWGTLKALQGHISAALHAIGGQPGPLEAAVSQFESALGALDQTLQPDLWQETHLACVRSKAMLILTQGYNPALMTLSMAALDTAITGLQDENRRLARMELQFIRAELQAKLALLDQSGQAREDAAAGFARLIAERDGPRDRLAAIEAEFKLAAFLAQCAQQSRDKVWMERAIVCCEHLLQRCPAGHSVDVLQLMGDVYHAARADKENGRLWAEMALECFTLAKTFIGPQTPAGQRLYIDRMRGSILLKKGKKNRNDKLLNTAMLALRDAVAAIEPGMPAAAQNALYMDYGAALLATGNAMKDEALLSEAVSVFMQALALRGNDRSSMAAVRCIAGLGDARLALAELRQDEALMQEALNAQQEAHSLARRHNYAKLERSASAKLEAAGQALARLTQNG